MIMLSIYNEKNCRFYPRCKYLENDDFSVVSTRDLYIHFFVVVVPGHYSGMPNYILINLSNTI